AWPTWRGCARRWSSCCRSCSWPTTIRGAPWTTHRHCARSWRRRRGRARCSTRRPEMARWSARVDPPWDVDAWRGIARHALQAQVAPEDIDWQDGDAPATLLSAPDIAEAVAQPVEPRAPGALPGLAADVLCHREPQRLGLLYRMLWRSNHGEPRLLSNPADADVRRAQ